MLLSKFITESVLRLETIYPLQEARAIVLRLCQELLEVKSYTHIIEPQYLIPDDKINLLNSCLERLSKAEPLQYVLGYTEFRNRRYNVNPSVLIPRPETEALIDLALEDLPQGARVLDLCTGSGCIAWSIAFERPDCSIFAVDISEAALATAISQFEILAQDCRTSLRCVRNDEVATTALNNDRHCESPFSSLRGACDEVATTALNNDRHCESPFSSLRGEAVAISSPTFIQLDILDPKSIEYFCEPFDLIVSNPPYIKESERSLMHKNVLEYEPSLALFVPNEYPLLFYKSLKTWVKSLLKPGGKAVFEINENLFDETKAIFDISEIENSSLFCDFLLKKRFLRLKKSAL